jgi:hypothetical protein
LPSSLQGFTQIAPESPLKSRDPHKLIIKLFEGSFPLKCNPVDLYLLLPKENKCIMKLLGAITWPHCTKLPFLLPCIKVIFINDPL